MLTIIIGICLVAIAIAICNQKIGRWQTSFVLIVIGTIINATGIAAPINGYNEYVAIDEVKISPIGLNKENNTDIYIIQLENEDKIYISINENNEEKLETYDKSIKLEIIEQEKCETPMLVHYFRPVKKSIFSLGINSVGEKYVFYVPKGSVIK